MAPAAEGRSCLKHLIFISFFSGLENHKGADGGCWVYMDRTALSESQSQDHNTERGSYAGYNS